MFLQKSRPIKFFITNFATFAFQYLVLGSSFTFLLSLLGIFWSIRRTQNVSAKKVDQFDFIDNFATLEFQYSVWFQSFTFFIKSTWNVLVDTSHPKSFSKKSWQIWFYRQFCHLGVLVLGFRKPIIDPKIQFYFKSCPQLFYEQHIPWVNPLGVSFGESS